MALQNDSDEDKSRQEQTQYDDDQSEMETKKKTNKSGRTNLSTPKPSTGDWIWMGPRSGRQPTEWAVPLSIGRYRAESASSTEARVGQRESSGQGRPAVPEGRL